MTKSLAGEVKIHVKGQYCAGPNCDCGYKSKHTPGPWKIINDRDDFLLHGFNYDDHKQPLVITDEEEPWIIASIVGGLENNEEKANAALIAAAPELLEALKAVQDGFKDGSIKWAKKRQADSEPYHKANTLMCQAIAKAEGRA